MGHTVFYRIIYPVMRLRGPIVVNIMPQNGQKLTFHKIYGIHRKSTVSFTVNSWGAGWCTVLDMGLVTGDNTSIIYRPWQWFPRREAGYTQFISRCTRFNLRLPQYRTWLIRMRNTLHIYWHVRKMSMASFQTPWKIMGNSFFVTVFIRPTQSRSGTSLFFSTLEPAFKELRVVLQIQSFNKTALGYFEIIRMIVTTLRALKAMYKYM